MKTNSIVNVEFIPTFRRIKFKVEKKEESKEISTALDFIARFIIYKIYQKFFANHILTITWLY